MPREHEFHLLAVADVVDETADARSFVLEVPPGLEPAFRYAAGQFCTFRAMIDGAPVARCYSMSSSPDTGDCLTVTVKRVAGGRMSNWMNDALVPGDAIEATPPVGRFVLRASDVPIVAFAGGSGITPILSIVKSALATTTREIALVYANRDAASVIFGGALERLRRDHPGRLSVHHHLDADRGFLAAPACADLAGDRTRADFYVCGPSPFMDVVEAGLTRRGVGPAQLFVERFDLPGDAPAGTESSATESIGIRIDRRNHTVRYEPGETILSAARRAGLKPPFACEAGSCGTCMAFLDEGTATMRRNGALEADEVEAGWVLTCQAIPTSRQIVVDFDR